MNTQNLLELINDVRKEVENFGYTYRSLEPYNRVWNYLIAYCNDNNIIEYSIDVGNSFLEFKYSFPDEFDRYSCKRAFRVIMILNSYMQYGKIRTKYFLTKTILSDFSKQLLNDFLNYCEKLGNAVKTIDYKKTIIKKFLKTLEEFNINNLNNISIKEIQGFLENINTSSGQTIKIHLYSVRSFLDFLYQTNKTNRNLSYIVPKVKVSKYPLIPSVWKKEDVEKLIKAIDTNNPIGKRDYAMLLIVAKLGIRVMDLKHLSLDNINWQKKTIDIIQSKTKNPLSLPLLDDIGWAIIDYLQNGRPHSDSKIIFLRHRPPIEPFSDTDAMQGIIKKYVKLANIEFKDNDIHKKGMHSLRHSLATNLLKNNIPIDNISSILGHSNNSSVSYYLKIDTDRLLECCGGEDDEL